MKLINNISDKEFNNKKNLINEDLFEKFKKDIRYNPVYFLNYIPDGFGFDIIINPRKKGKGIRIDCMYNDSNHMIDIIMSSPTNYLINPIINKCFENGGALGDYDSTSIYLFDEKLIKLYLNSNVNDIKLLKDIIQNSSKPIKWNELK